jgi:Cu(I)/Ag(I) efflux system membrane fusion protein
MLKPPKQKLLFHGLSNAQIESIKGKKQIFAIPTFIVLTADIFRNSGTEGHVMEGAAM